MTVNLIISLFGILVFIFVSSMSILSNKDIILLIFFFELIINVSTKSCIKIRLLWRSFSFWGRWRLLLDFIILWLLISLWILLLLLFILLTLKFCLEKVGEAASDAACRFLRCCNHVTFRLIFLRLFLFIFFLFRKEWHKATFLISLSFGSQGSIFNNFFLFYRNRLSLGYGCCWCACCCCVLLEDW